MRATIPTALVDNTYEPFPEGEYDGDIDEVEIRDVKKDGSWITARFALTNVTPKEGTQDPGRDKLNVEITLSSDDYNVAEIENWNDKNIPFGVRKSGGLLGGIAEAVGVGTRSPAGIDCSLPDVVAALGENAFKGERVGFQVQHYTSKKDGQVREQIGKFGLPG